MEYKYKNSLKSTMAEKIVTRSDITAMTDTSGFGVVAENKCLTRLVVASGITRGVQVNFMNKTSYKTNQLVKKSDISPMETIYMFVSSSGPVGVVDAISDASSGVVNIPDDLTFMIFADDQMETELQWPCVDSVLSSIIFRLDNGTYTTLFKDDMYEEVVVNSGVQEFTFNAAAYTTFNVRGGTLNEEENIYISGLTFEAGNTLQDNENEYIFWNYQFVDQEL